MLSLMASGGVALVIAILGTPLLMRWLARRRIGQHIREEGPASHTAKADTPTMGGLAIVGAVCAGYVMGHVGTEVRFSATGYLVVITVFAYGAIGAVDDWIKVRHRRSLGLNKRAKLAAQVGVGVLVAELAEHWAHTATTLSFTSQSSPGWELGQVGWVVFAVLVIVATSNAVNLTDGLDGLAAGSSTMCFAVLAIMGYWIFRHQSIYHVLPASAIDLALASVALAGACLGFLWWNAAPARIFMGDTGSLAIGSGLARAVPAAEPRPAAAHPGRPVRDRDPVGDHPDHLLPGLRQAGLPHGPLPPPLRAAGLARDHRHRAVLDPRRPVRRPGPGHLLRRFLTVAKFP